MSASTRPRLSLGVLGIAITACRGGDRAADPAAGSTVSPRPTATASAATQTDLAHELEAIDRAPDPEAAMISLRARWQGRRLTWTVVRQRALCPHATACNVVPFPAPRPADVAAHGWLPRLELTAAAFAELAAGCGTADACEVTFAGDLVELKVSDDEPTALRFDHVRIVTATAAAAPGATRKGG